MNGGDGVMLGDAPSVETLARIAAAHGRLGATGILPTLITDTPQVTRAVVAAAADAVARGVPGVLGLHLEGPHLAPAKKGAHRGDLIRPMGDADLALILDAAARLPVLMVTVAPEVVTPAQIAAMAAAGVVVSLGHSDADYDTCLAAARAGARCVTHLFNAMSQLGSRAPGLVGAALDCAGLDAGLIADGLHVHPATMAAALRAKAGAVFLVSDAMAVAGTGLDGFDLHGRRIARAGGRLTLADGTLAGADLDMARAVRVVRGCGIPKDRALAMATSVPARVAGLDGPGRLRPGAPADFVALDAGLHLTGVWRGGVALNR